MNPDRRSTPQPPGSHRRPGAGARGPRDRGSADALLRRGGVRHQPVRLGECVCAGRGPEHASRFRPEPVSDPERPVRERRSPLQQRRHMDQQFARGAGLGGSVKAALGSSSTEANNYAVGAARAWEDGVNFNLTRQVSTFLSRSGTDVSPTALYDRDGRQRRPRRLSDVHIRWSYRAGPRGRDPDGSTRVDFGEHPNALPRRCARLPGMVVAKHRTHTRNPAARPAGRRAGRRIGSVLQLQPDQGGRRTFSRASRCDLRPARRVQDSGGDRGTSRKLSVSPTPRPRALRRAWRPIAVRMPTITCSGTAFTRPKQGTQSSLRKRQTPSGSITAGRRSTPPTRLFDLPTRPPLLPSRIASCPKLNSCSPSVLPYSYSRGTPTRS